MAERTEIDRDLARADLGLETDDEKAGPVSRFRRKFQRRRRNLEITIKNKTTNVTLEFVKEHFSSGTWYMHFNPDDIPPGKHSKALVVNNRALSGVSGGFMFKIDLEDRNKYVYIGFSNPAVGSYKTCVTISNEDLGPKHGYDNAKDDSHKLLTIEGFQVEATLNTPVEGGNKQMIFTFSDA